MNDTQTASLLANPIWHALTTHHREFAVTSGNAARYPAELAPFVAVGDARPASMRQLHSLLTPGENVWIRGENHPLPNGMTHEQTLEVIQMIWPQSSPTYATEKNIVALTNDHAPEMLALTAIAFPDFFRARTCEMGQYWGIRSASGELVSMCGERMRVRNTTELSGICTHPDHRGKNYAASLIRHLAGIHQKCGIISWLHVTRTNVEAVNLYKKLGFETFSDAVYSRLQCQ